MSTSGTQTDSLRFLNVHRCKSEILKTSTLKSSGEVRKSGFVLPPGSSLNVVRIVGERKKTTQFPREQNVEQENKALNSDFSQHGHLFGLS